LVVTDSDGAPVARIGALRTRPVDASQIGNAAAHESMFEVRWSPVVAARAQRTNIVVLGRPPFDALAELRASLDRGAAAPGTIVAVSPRHASVRASIAWALGVLQGFIGERRLAAARLVFVTERAIAAGPHEDVPNLVDAPLWGLLRSAMT